MSQIRKKLRVFYKMNVLLILIFKNLKPSEVCKILKNFKRILKIFELNLMKLIISKVKNISGFIL